MNGIERYPFSVILDENWPFCVLLWLHENHYEIIGKSEPNSVIRRVFYKEDELIEHFWARKNDLGACASDAVGENG